MFTFRHRCPECGERFAVRILEGDLTSCPKCNAVVPAMPEPCDEHWWTWFVAQPLNRKMLNLPPLYVAEEAPRAPSRTRPVKEPPTIEEKRKERDGRLAGL